VNPIIDLVATASWRRLQQAAGQQIGADESNASSVAKLCYQYVAVPPYEASDLRECLQALAEINPLAASSLALYRVSLCAAYRQIACQRHSLAKDHAVAAMIFLHEGLHRLQLLATPLQDETLALSCKLVTCLAAQYELQDALIRQRFAPRLVFVLGMHRSGTSALSGLLCQAGLFAPADPIPADEANPKGYWESVSINNANEDFLASIDSHWSSSLPLARDWIYGDLARQWRSQLIAALSRSYGGASLPLIKDPRFCLLLAGLEPWLQSGLMQCAFVLPVRHPFEVANSLHKSQGISYLQALRLWSKSIFLSDIATHSYPRIFVSFDAIMARPHQVLDACLDFVTASIPDCRLPDRSHSSPADCTEGQDAVAFINPDLRRQQPLLDQAVVRAESANVSLPRLADFAQAAYRALLAAIDDPDQVSRVLAAWRPELNYALL
jgi:hypothetical protein